MRTQKQHALTRSLLIIALLLALAQCEDGPRDLTFSLKRTRLDPWMKRKHQDQDAVCFKPSTSAQKPHSYDVAPHPACDKGDTVTVTQPCAFRNLFYTISAGVASYKDQFTLAVDLASPWTWVKDSKCYTCAHDGEECVRGCVTGDAQHDNYFACGDHTSSCDEQPKCAQIDLFAEGMSVQGQWVKTRVHLGSKKSSPAVREYKVLTASKLSGHQLFEADGVLGLGQEYLEPARRDDDMNVYEPGSAFMQSLLVSTDGAAQRKVVALYLGEEGQESIQFGAYDTSHVYRIEQHPLVPSKCDPYDEDDERFYQWRVKIEHFEVLKIAEGADTIKREDQIRIDSFTQSAVLTLSTTAIVLPEKPLNDLLSVFQAHYGVSCAVDASRFYFVVCSGLREDFRFEGLALRITLKQSVPLFVDPDDLVQACRETRGDAKSYECILNLALANNDVAVLGEAALKNSYVVLDYAERQVWFAPAVTQYNEDLLTHLENVVIEFGRDMEQEASYILRLCVFASLLTALVIFYMYPDAIKERLNHMCDRVLGVRVVAKVHDVCVRCTAPVRRCCAAFVRGLRRRQRSAEQIPVRNADDVNVQHNISELQQEYDEELECETDNDI